MKVKKRNCAESTSNMTESMRHRASSRIQGIKQAIIACKTKKMRIALFKGRACSFLASLYQLKPY
jgi:hypothetical protein